MRGAPQLSPVSLPAERSTAMHSRRNPALRCPGKRDPPACPPATHPACARLVRGPLWRCCRPAQPQGPQSRCLLHRLHLEGGGQEQQGGNVRQGQQRQWFHRQQHARDSPSPPSTVPAPAHGFRPSRPAPLTMSRVISTGARFPGIKAVVMMMSTSRACSLNSAICGRTGGRKAGTVGRLRGQAKAQGMLRPHTRSSPRLLPSSCG